MHFTRNRFFLLLALLVTLPFVVPKLVWIAGTKATIGRMWFESRTIEVQGVSRHPVYRFKAGADSVWFDGSMDLGYKRGDLVPVRYREDDPYDARVNTVFSLWVDTLLYLIFPGLVLLILFIKPDIIPRKARVRVGRKPLVTIIHDEH